LTCVFDQGKLQLALILNRNKTYKYAMWEDLSFSLGVTARIMDLSLVLSGFFHH
jgi:hypothetical protein